MLPLICHLIGDYVVQNHWMAANKTKAWWPALVHATTYMLPFLILTRNPLALLVMWGTHLVIDRFRLARYWVEFWGVGCEGEVCATIRTLSDPTNASAPPAAPDYLRVWLLILVDNTLHLAINQAALALA